MYQTGGGNIGGMTGGASSSPDQPKPTFQTPRADIILEIRGLIPLLNESSANLSLAIQHLQRDKNGHVHTDKIPHDSIAWEPFSKFSFELFRIFDNSLEKLPSDLIRKYLAWKDKVLLTRKITDKAVDVYREGMNLSTEVQKHLYNLGIKDSNKEEFVTFPFQYYLDQWAYSRIQFIKQFSNNFSNENTHLNDAGTSTFDDDGESINDFQDPQTQAQGQGEQPHRPDPMNSIIGFSGDGAFGSMYFTLFSHVNRLLTFNQADLAISYFYKNLGNFASIFDVTFLQRCIKIENDVLNPPAPPVQKPFISCCTWMRNPNPSPSEMLRYSEYHVSNSLSQTTYKFKDVQASQKRTIIFQMHLSELAWLMKRAGITPNPDIMQIALTNLETPRYAHEVTKY